MKLNVDCLWFCFHICNTWVQQEQLFWQQPARVSKDWAICLAAVCMQDGYTTSESEEMRGEGATDWKQKKLSYFFSFSSSHFEMLSCAAQIWQFTPPHTYTLSHAHAPLAFDLLEKNILNFASVHFCQILKEADLSITTPPSSSYLNHHHSYKDVT